VFQLQGKKMAGDEAELAAAQLNYDDAKKAADEADSVPEKKVEDEANKALGRPSKAEELAKAEAELKPLKERQDKAAQDPDVKAAKSYLAQMPPSQEQLNERRTQFGNSLIGEVAGRPYGAPKRISKPCLAPTPKHSPFEPPIKSFRQFNTDCLAASNCAMNSFDLRLKPARKVKNCQDRQERVRSEHKLADAK
jgi:hypothetical protein